MTFHFESYAGKLAKLFIKHQAAYTLVYFKNTHRWNFHPITSQANKQALTGDLKVVEEAGYSGATQHFITASKAIRDGAFDLSIRESFIAAEVVATDLTGESRLGKSLKALVNSESKKSENGYKTLIEGFNKITSYAHTFRHPKEKKSDNMAASLDEAILMFSVNAAIAGYLAAKARKEKEE